MLSLNGSLFGMGFSDTLISLENNFSFSASNYTCTDFIDTSYIEITIENCDNSVSICIEEAIAKMLSYSITDNGQAYSGGLSPCDFDTAYAYTYSSLPGGGLDGPYMVDSWNINGMVYSGIVADMAALRDSMNTWDSGGNWSLDIFTSTIRGGNPSKLYSSIHITQISSGDQGVLVKNTTLNPKGSRITLDTGFHELIFTEPNEGCQDTLLVQVNCIPCENLYDGETAFELDNCDDSQLLCFEIPPSKVYEYSISDNGTLYNGTTEACSANRYFSYDYSGLPEGGMNGPYLLQNWTVNDSVYQGEFNSIEQLVDSMNLWDNAAIWNLNDPEQTIIGGNPENTYGDIAVLQIDSGNTGIAPVSVIESVSSIEIPLDVGDHEMVFYNTVNQCVDSIDFSINCTPCTVYLGDTTIIQSANHCDDITGVCLPLPFSKINDYTFTVNGNPYTEGFSLCGSTSTEMQFDTGTFQLIVTHNISGCLDTATIIIDCIPEVICTDFISETFITLQSNDCESEAVLCLEIPFEEINNYAITANNLPYNGTLSDCNPGTNLSLEPGFYEIIFTHFSTGCADTIYSLVACIPPENINVSLEVLASDTICLDTSQLSGDIVSMTDVCEENYGELALVYFDTVNYCLILEGIEAGMEQVCIELCDSFGFCQTIFINIEVLPLIITEPETPPIARDDTIQTLEGQTVLIDVLNNDDINGLISSLGILDLPQKGEVSFDENNLISYTPYPDLCTPELPDSFSYILCNESDCDSATVFIAVICDDVTVYTAISPNGDGMNDVLFIEGAENHPANTLTVFNRWGAMVFFQKGYENNWDGIWNGRALPDGTYYYFYEEGNGSTASGYVQLQR